MSFRKRKEVPRGYLSYSNGTLSLDPYAFREASSGAEQIGAALRFFPAVEEVFKNQPIIISCYPSSLGMFQGFTVVDTYLRSNTFSRALLLAHSEKLPAVIIGQPLSTTHLCLNHFTHKLDWPESIVIALGGYYCPLSLEKFIRHIMGQCRVKMEMLFGYGVAEVEFGCMLGKRDRKSTDVVYRIISDTINLFVEEDSKRLHIKRVDDEAFFFTGDFAEKISDSNGDSYILWNDEARLAKAVKRELETWEESSWMRRTGYLTFNGNNDSFIFQLREGIAPITNAEREYHCYNQQHGASWSDKPVWGTPHSPAL
ncbi:MAG: hypothetical protein IT291_09315 [Deltaproteobacteria bacterium]|nr:hypothetical protein [Deltaproteobacteria bacterium]